MTRQEIFNKVADHLLTQGRVATSSTTLPTCAYRSTDGATCAVGCLIPDELYVPEMENKSVYTLLWYFPDLPDYLHTNSRLLKSLQTIHDGGLSMGGTPLLTRWYHHLMACAIENDLEPSEKMKEFSAKPGNLESA